MTKILNFALKIKGVMVGRVAHAKSSDPDTPQKFETRTCMKPLITGLQLS